MEQDNKWDLINQRKRTEIQVAQAVNLAVETLTTIREVSPLAGEEERKQLDKLFEFYFVYLREKTELKLKQFDALQRIAKSDIRKRVSDAEHIEQSNGAYTDE